MANSYCFTQPKLSKAYILSIFSGHWRLLYSPRAARPLATYFPASSRQIQADEHPEGARV